MPPFVVSSGPEVVELCRKVGLDLDPWQQLVLTNGLGEDEAGKWAAFEVGLDVARQNGKGEILMARELGGLFLLDERLILHTAHEFKTASEAFRRVVILVENSKLLKAQVKTIRRTTGEEGIELHSGARLRFLARSTSSGRGFTGDLIILDEAQILDSGPIEAMMPTLSAIPNPQVWYAGTAGVGAASAHLASVRRRGVAGGDPSLAYMEWSIDDDAYREATPLEKERIAADPEQWALANPAMGIRISEDYIGRERRAMSAEGFARERLGVGDWPSADDAFGVIPAEAWEACRDESDERP